MYKRYTCFPSKLPVIGLWYRSDRENGHISLIKQVEYQLVKRNQWHSDRGNGKYLYDKVLFFLWYSSYDFRILCGCPGYNKPCVVIYFHFSIFEPLETTQLLLSIHNQWFIIQIKNKKQTLFQSKNPALSRILAF